MLGLVVGALIVALLIAIMGWMVIYCGDTAAPEVSDLVPDVVHVPDQNNACIYLDQALASLQWPKNRPDLEATLNEWDDAFVIDLLSRNGQALGLLEQALACPAYQPYASGPQSQGSDSWGRIVLLLAQKAACERRTGRSGAAGRSSCGLLRLGSWIVSRPQSLSEWSLGLTALELGLEGIERLSHEAELGQTELVRLLERLNQVEVLDAGLAGAFKLEFQRISQAIDECALRVPQRSLWAGHAFQPNRTRGTAAQCYLALIRNTTLPYAQVRLPEVPPLRLSGIHRYLLTLEPNKQGRMLYALFLPEQNLAESCFVSKCRVQSDVDGLRLVIGCRLYEIRHGRLPETLTVLVPEVLAAVARDPFDGRPFRYSREDGVVYSVGKDLTDSWVTGERTPVSVPTSHTTESEAASDWPEYPSPRQLLSRTRYRAGDLVYHIHAQTQ
jgi:hypothetical protein